MNRRRRQAWQATLVGATLIAAGIICDAAVVERGWWTWRDTLVTIGLPLLGACLVAGAWLRVPVAWLRGRWRARHGRPAEPPEPVERVPLAVYDQHRAERRKWKCRRKRLRRRKHGGN